MKCSEVAKVTDPCHTLTASQRDHYFFVGEGQNERHILNRVKGEVFFFVSNIIKRPTSLDKV